MSDTRLQGRVVLITGGASGLGAAAATAAAREGATVVLADRNLDLAEATAARIAAEHDGRAEAVRLDVSVAAEVEEVVAGVVARHGRIDVLANNAGVPGLGLRAGEVTDESWERVMAVNVTGPFLMARAVIPHMLARRRGVVINTCSAAGLVASVAGAEYTTAKHALVGLTKQLAFDYGHEGIRVVGIAPGVIAGTELTAGEGIRSGRWERVTRNAPAGRYGTPADFARTFVFLASDDADFIHGTTVALDGGSSVVTPR